MSTGVQIRVTKSGYVIYAVDQNIQDVLKFILNWCGLLIPIKDPFCFNVFSNIILFFLVLECVQ